MYSVSATLRDIVYSVSATLRDIVYSVSATLSRAQLWLSRGRECSSHAPRHVEVPVDQRDRLHAQDIALQTPTVFQFSQISRYFGG